MIEGGLSPRGVEVLDLFFRYVDMDVMYINQISYKHSLCFQIEINLLRNSRVSHRETGRLMAVLWVVGCGCQDRRFACHRRRALCTSAHCFCSSLVTSHLLTKTPLNISLSSRVSFARVVGRYQFLLNLISTTMSRFLEPKMPPAVRCLRLHSTA
jgi:hypothetical protein